MDLQHPAPTVAESALVALLLQRPALIPETASQLASGAFLNPVMAGIYGQICAMHATGAGVDNVTLTRHLHAKGLLDSLGGPGLLAELYAQDVMVSELHGLIQQISDDHHTRQTRAAGAALAAATDSHDTRDALDRLAALQRRASGDGDAAREYPDAPWHMFDMAFAQLAEVIGEEYSLSGIGPLIASHVIFGGLIGKALELELTGPWRVHPNIYAIGVGETGSGKSATVSPLIREAIQLDAFVMEIAAKSKRKYAAIAEAEKAKLAKLTAAYAKGQATKDEIEKAAGLVADAEAMRPAIAQLVIQDATGEATAAAAADGDGAILSITTEARQAIDVLRGKYLSGGGSDTQMWLAGSSYDDIKISRKGSGTITINRPCLSCCWFTQPDLFDAIMSDDQLAVSGYTRRLLNFTVPVCSDAPKEKPEAIPEPLLTHWRNRCREAVFMRSPDDDNTAPAPRKCTLSPGAAGHIYALRCEAKKDISDPFAAAFIEFVGKWALILHAAQYGPAAAPDYQVTLDTVQRADAIMRWFAANRKQSACDAPQVKRLQALSSSHALDGFKLRDVQLKTPQLTADQARALCGQWCAQGLVGSVQTIGRNKRPGVLYKVTEEGWKMLRNLK